MPYYIGGVIEDAADLTLQTPASFFTRFRVDMRVRHEVTAIHPQRKTVSVTNLATGEAFEESYDKLLLSPGAKPVQPPLPGIERTFTLRTVEDTLRIKAYVEAQQPRSAVMVGGGFIGLAESKVKEEHAARQLAEETDKDGLRRLMTGIAKSSRLVAEDILREAGYMLPQSANTRQLLEDIRSVPGVPTEAVETLLNCFGIMDR